MPTKASSKPLAKFDRDTVKAIGAAAKAGAA